MASLDGAAGPCHFAGTLLDSDALVVLVDGLQRTDTRTQGPSCPGRIPGSEHRLVTLTGPRPRAGCSLLSSLVTETQAEGRRPQALAPHPLCSGRLPPQAA